MQRGDVAAEVLIGESFSRLDISSDFETTLRKLLSGRVAMMVVSDALLESLRNDYPRLEKVMTILTVRYGIACNKAVDSGTIARLNASLAKMIASGRQRDILTHYGIDQTY